MYCCHYTRPEHSNLFSGVKLSKRSFCFIYTRHCSHYDDFRYHRKRLVEHLLSQDYIALQLEKSFKKFYERYQNLIEKYQRSVKEMVNVLFPR